MTVSARGAISKPFELLATLVANCAAFQTAVGAANATEALTFIDYPEFVPPEADEDGNFAVPAGAVITEDDQCQFSWNFNTGRMTGELLLTIRLPVDEQTPETSKDALAEYCNVLGDIFDQMQALSGTPNNAGEWYMGITTITKVTTPDYCRYVNNPNPNIAGKQFYGSTYKITWI